MTLSEIIKEIPSIVTVFGGWVTGLFSFYIAWRAHRAKQIKTKNDLLAEYKQMYIKQSIEFIQLLESDSLKRRLLIEMRNFCPECYATVTKKIGYETNDLEKDS